MVTLTPHRLAANAKPQAIRRQMDILGWDASHRSRNIIA